MRVLCNLQLIYFLVSLSNMSTIMCRHSQSEAKVRLYREIYKKEHLKTGLFDKETSTYC